MSEKPIFKKTQNELTEEERIIVENSDPLYLMVYNNTVDQMYELTDEMKDQFRETILNEMVNEAMHTAVDQWIEESDIVYTEAGEAWKLPEADEDYAEEDAEVPAEEAAEAPAEETPAE